MMKMKRGFTYVEISATLLLLVLIAAMVTPQLMHLNEGRLISEFKSDVKSLPVAAKELAVSRGQTVQVRYDEDGAQIVIETVPNNNDNTSTSPSTSIRDNSIFSSADLTNEQGQQLKAIAVPQSISISSYMLNGATSDGSSWVMYFYPEGTADSGGLGFTARNYEFSLSIREDGRYSLQDGSIQDLSTQKWQAGDYEHR